MVRTLSCKGQHCPIQIPTTVQPADGPKLIPLVSLSSMLCAAGFEQSRFWIKQVLMEGGYIFVRATPVRHTFVQNISNWGFNSACSSACRQIYVLNALLVKNYKKQVASKIWGRIVVFRIIDAEVGSRFGNTHHSRAVQGSRFPKLSKSYWHRHMNIYV